MLPMATTFEPARQRCPAQPNRFDGTLQVGVGHDQERVLGAAKRLDALALGRGRGVNMLGHRAGTDHAHRLDVRMGHDFLGDAAGAVNDIEHAGRGAAGRKQLGQTDGGQRRPLGRFEHERIAAGHGHRNHPQRNHDGKVEGGESRHHAQRLPDHLTVNARGDILQHRAHAVRGDAGGKLDDLDAALHVAGGFAQGLAVIQNDQLDQFAAMFFEFLLKAEQHPRSLHDRRTAPDGEGLARAGHGVLDFVGG
jgi:hypothetical protein